MAQITRCRLLQSAGFGLLGVVAFALIAILVIPSVGITVLILPGAALAPILGPLLERLGPFVAVDGPELGVGLLVVGGASLWWLLFSAIAFALTDERAA